MKMTVEYEAQVKKAAGVAAEDVELEEPCTHQKLIRFVAKKHGEPLETMLLDTDGKLQKAMLLFLKDEQIRWEDSIELSEGDVLTILSPISGG